MLTSSERELCLVPGETRIQIISMSIYIERGLAHDKTPIGKHERPAFTKLYPIMMI
jgi:hypothetical protein